MREIEFRGKRIIDDTWIYGGYIKTHRTNKSLIGGTSRFCQIKPETLGQYTGLKDNNGTKIFEGDIVKYTRKNMYAPTASFHNQDIVSLHKICWNEEKHAFYQQHYKIESKQCKCIGGGSLNFNDERAEKNIIEVIGNIYDNPELIKE